MRSIVLALTKVSLAAGLVCVPVTAALADCCRLVKVEAEPASVGVRVCAVDTGPECAVPLFEGELAHGTPAPICSSGTQVIYRELDSTSGELSAPTTAACTASADVEL